jgi:predicted MFS family arabinose efflux permease
MAVRTAHRGGSNKRATAQPIHANKSWKESGMRRLQVMALSAAAMASALFTVPSQAAPAFVVPSLDSMSGTAQVQEVQLRYGHRHHRHHHHGWRGRDALIGLGIGAVAGSIIASQPYGYGYGYGAPYAYGGPVYGGGAVYADTSGWERCQAEFRSFQSDGTYTTYSGEQKLCPYLR